MIFGNVSLAKILWWLILKDGHAMEKIRRWIVDELSTFFYVVKDGCFEGVVDSRGYFLLWLFGRNAQVKF
jgi:hypothetical protein